MMLISSATVSLDSSHITHPEPKLEQILLLDLVLLRQQLIDIPLGTHQPSAQPRPLLARQPHAKGATEINTVDEIWDPSQSVSLHNTVGNPTHAA
jgi:hypothetical protein